MFPGEQHEGRREVVEGEDACNRTGDVVRFLDRCLRGSWTAADLDEGGGKEEWTEVAPAEAADSLDEATEYEGEVVSTCDAVLTWGEFGGTTRTSNLSTNPECACSECNHAARKPRLLAFGRDPLVNALTEPDIRFHVPGVQQNLHVRRKFD